MRWKRRPTRSTARSSTSAQTGENYRVREIARDRRPSVFPGCEVTVGPQVGTTAATACRSTRSPAGCRASSASGPRRAGAEELQRVFERIEMSQRTPIEFRAFTRLKQLQYLQRTRQIDDELFWTV